METKPSVYTSEFWIWVFSTIGTVGQYADAWHLVNQKWLTIGYAIITAAYQISRGWAKSKGTFDPGVKANWRLFPSRKSFTR